MFGYVVIDKPNILIKDYQTYRAYYCGLCKAIGNQSGNMMRFTLNYDIVLLALLAHNYEEKTPIFKTGRCIVHPIGKLNYVEKNELLTRISDINTILGYYKIVDDVIDENKHKIIKAGLVPYYKKAKKRLPQLDKRVSECYNKLREYELAKAEVGILSDCFGQLMIAVAENLTDKCDNNLREMCFYIGKWVYIIDAIDDLRKDFDEKNYNPFLSKIKEWDDNIYIELDSKFKICTNECIDKIIEIYEKMDVKVSEGALSNIIYRGLIQRTEFIINKRGVKCQKTRL
jgi:hypothetical protein